MSQACITLVVAVALVDGAGRVLMQRRPPGKQHGGLWEFPGGKVEPGETLATAARREIDEELGLSLTAEALVPVSFAETDAARPLALMLFLAREWGGVPECRDASAIGWYAPADLAALAMPPLDVSLAAAVVRMLAVEAPAKKTKVGFRRLPTRKDALRGAAPTHP